jgi:SAM-dependent methyltransferase
VPIEYDQQYTRYQTDRSAFRRCVRKAYLGRAKRLLRGPTLDIGCGVGELLSRLPPDSMGLEYNQATVTHCREKGLDVSWYDGYEDDWQLSVIPPGRRFESLVLSHVLEHFDEPAQILKKLLVSTDRFGVHRCVIFVPGKAGFRIDPTHRTFVSAAMLHGVIASDRRWKVERAVYFPVPGRWLGDFFPHHELQFVIDKIQR